MTACALYLHLSHPQTTITSIESGAFIASALRSTANLVQGQTVLHIAAYDGDACIMEVLLTHGADAHAVWTSRVTPAPGCQSACVLDLSFSGKAAA